MERGDTGPSRRDDLVDFLSSFRGVVCCNGSERAECVWGFVCGLSSGLVRACSVWYVWCVVKCIWCDMLCVCVCESVGVRVCDESVYVCTHFRGECRGALRALAQLVVRAGRATPRTLMVAI